MPDCTTRAFDVPEKQRDGWPDRMERVVDSQGATVAWVIDGVRYVRARERDWDEVECDG